MNNVKKIIIYYFSGTGNARQIVLWFLEFALKKNISCQLVNIAKTDIYKINTLDSDSLVFIISPVHGFNFPKITLDFILPFWKVTDKIKCNLWKIETMNR